MVDFPADCQGLWSDEEHLLKAFLMLRSLSIKSYDQPDNSFLDALKEMHHLTELELPIQDEGFLEALAASASPLTGLGSLTLSGSGMWFIPPVDERHLKSLKHLTEFSMVHYPVGRSFPTGLRSLDLIFRDCPPVDFAEVLVTMTNLTSLDIQIPHYRQELNLFHSDGVTPAQFSGKLAKLKRLSIRHVAVDDSFLDAVGMLTQLTSLFFENYITSVDPYVLYPQLSNLTELIELNIFCLALPPTRNNEFPQLCLPKLRKLDFSLSSIDANVCRAMWKTLPCLRKMSLLGKTLEL